MLLVDIGCSSKRAPLSVSYYNEISGGHIGSCRCSEEGLCRPSTAPVVGTRCPLILETFKHVIVLLENTFIFLVSDTCK